MSKFVVSTQVLENYGCQNGSGRFSDGSAYWKAKWGSDWIVEGLDRYQDAWALVAAVTCNDLGYKEIPVNVQSYDEWQDGLYNRWVAEHPEDEQGREAYDFYIEQAQKRVLDPRKPETIKAHSGWRNNQFS